MKTPRLVMAAILSIGCATLAFPADKTVGDSVDDTTITASVKGALVGEKGVPATKVNVETYKGVVLLSGFVEKQEQKDAAGKVAGGVKGVKEVRNQVAVHEATSVGAKIDDTMLNAKVKTALINNKDVNASQINVETRGGIVQLAGFVRSTDKRNLALETARKVEGVKRVDDALFIKPE